MTLTVPQPDKGKLLSSVVQLWNLNAENPATEPRMLQDARSPVSTSPDGHWLITGGPGDGTVRIWDLTAKDPSARSRTLLGHTAAIEDLVISPDGRWLITGSIDGTARVWDWERTPKPIILKGQGQPITVLAVSADSRWVATGSFGGEWLLLWDMTAKDPASSSIALPVTGRVTSATFKGDGQRIHWLVTESSDPGSGPNRICLWNMRLDELIRLACRTAGRNLTEKEWQQYFYGRPYQKTCPDPP